MAINKKPKNSSSDANKNKSDAYSQENTPEKSPFSYSKGNSVEEGLLVPVTSSVSSEISLNRRESKLPAIKPPRQRHWWQAWQFWGIVLILCSGGVGYGATSILFKLPKMQSCSKVFWPVASASVRLYCAQTAAEDKSIAGLLEAIDLVAILPETHPLRPEINRNIEQWTTGILEIGEQQFQEGKLKQAIATAQKTPENVAARKLVEAKIENWQKIWQKGEETYAQVESKLREANWDEAFTWAVRLTDSPNQYWATIKYEESINNINIAQEQSAAIVKARNQLSNGSLDDLFLAIDKAEDIEQNSYAYEQAQEIMAQAKDKLLLNIKQLIEKQEWRKLFQVTNRIPNSLNLQDKIDDWNILASAGTSADLDTVFGMEEAIAEAQKLTSDSPYYEKAQKLIQRWELEIEDVRHLSQAKQLARVGTIVNLNKAIAEASLIPESNPRYPEARQEINQWRRKIRLIEDQPILNRAKKLAFGNNINAWRRAIAEAKLISSNSPLYREAQNYVSTWRANIQRTEDRPILDRAISLANINNYVAAIDEARKIASGRVLYRDAQAKISLWRKEIDGEKYFREANILSDRGTPEALAKAITVARQVSSSTSNYLQVVQNINAWSSEILALARQASNTSLSKAIAIAQLVPLGTSSHSQAQSDIQIWTEKLNPPEPEVAPLSPSFKLEKLKKKRNNEN